MRPSQLLLGLLWSCLLLSSTQGFPTGESVASSDRQQEYDGGSNQRIKRFYCPQARNPYFTAVKRAYVNRGSPCVHRKPATFPVQKACCGGGSIVPTKVCPLTPTPTIITDGQLVQLFSKFVQRNGRDILNDGQFHQATTISENGQCVRNFLEYVRQHFDIDTTIDNAQGTVVDGETVRRVLKFAKQNLVPDTSKINFSNDVVTQSDTDAVRQFTNLIRQALGVADSDPVLPNINNIVAGSTGVNLPSTQTVDEIPLPYIRPSDEQLVQLFLTYARQNLGFTPNCGQFQTLTTNVDFVGQFLEYVRHNFGLASATVNSQGHTVDGETVREFLKFTGPNLGLNQDSTNTAAHIDSDRVKTFSNFIRQTLGLTDTGPVLSNDASTEVRAINNIQNQVSSSNSILQTFLNPTQSIFGDSDAILPDVTNTNNQAINPVQNNINNVVGSGMASQNGLNTLTSSGQTVRGFADNVQNQMSSSNSNLQPFLNPAQSTFGDLDPILPDVTNTNNQAMKTVQNNINNVVGSGMASQNGLNTLTSSGQTVRGFANNVQNQMSSSNSNLQPFLNPTQSTFGDSDPILPDVTNTNNQAMKTVQNNINNVVGSGMASQNGLNTLTSSGQTVRGFANNVQNQMSSSNSNLQPFLNPAQSTFGDSDPILPDVTNTNYQAINTVQNNFNNAVGFDIASRNGPNTLTSSGQTVRGFANNVQNQMSSSNGNLQPFLNPTQSTFGDSDPILLEVTNTNNQAINTVQNNINNVVGSGMASQNGLNTLTSSGQTVRGFANNVQNQISSSNSNLQPFLNPAQSTFGDSDPILPDVTNTNNQAMKTVHNNINNVVGSGMASQNGLNTLTSSGQTVRGFANNVQNQMSSLNSNLQPFLNPTQSTFGDSDPILPDVTNTNNQATKTVQNNINNVVGSGMASQNGLNTLTSSGQTVRGFANNVQNQMSSSNGNLQPFLNPTQSTFGDSDPILPDVTNTNNQAINTVQNNINNVVGSGMASQNGLNTLTSSGQNVRGFANNVQNQMSSSNSNLQPFLNPTQSTFKDSDPILPDVTNTNNQAINTVQNNFNNVVGSGMASQNGLNTLTSIGQTVRGFANNVQNQMSSSNSNLQPFLNPTQSTFGDSDPILPDVTNTNNQAMQTVQNNINNVVGSGMASQNGLNVLTSSGQTVRGFANNVQNQMSSSNSNLQPFLNPTQSTFGDSDPILPDVTNTSNQAINTVQNNFNNAVGFDIASRNGPNTLTSSGQTVRGFANNVQNQMSSSNGNLQPFLNPTQSTFGDSDPILPDVTNTNNQAINTVQNNFNNVVGSGMASQNGLNVLTSSGQTVRGFANNVQNQMSSSNSNLQSFLNPTQSTFGDSDPILPDVTNPNNQAINTVQNNFNNVVGSGMASQNGLNVLTSSGQTVRGFANNVQNQMSSSNSNLRPFLNPTQSTFGDSDPILPDVTNTNNQAINTVQNNFNNAVGFDIASRNGPNTLTSSGQTVRGFANNVQNQMSSSNGNLQPFFNPTQSTFGDSDPILPDVTNTNNQAINADQNNFNNVVGSGMASQNGLNVLTSSGQTVRGFANNVQNQMSSSNSNLQPFLNPTQSTFGDSDPILPDVMNSNNQAMKTAQNNINYVVGSGMASQNGLNTLTSSGQTVGGFANIVQNQMSSSNSNLQPFLNPTQSTFEDSDPILPDVTNTNNQAINTVQNNFNNAVGFDIASRNGPNTLTSSGQNVRGFANNVQNQMSSSNGNLQPFFNPTQSTFGDSDPILPDVTNTNNQAINTVQNNFNNAVGFDIASRKGLNTLTSSGQTVRGFANNVQNQMSSSNSNLQPFLNPTQSTFGDSDPILPEVTNTNNQAINTVQNNINNVVGSGMASQNGLNTLTSSGQTVRGFANNVQNQMSSSNSNLQPFLNPTQSTFGDSDPILPDVTNTNNQAMETVQNNINNVVGSGMASQNGLNTLTSIGQTVRGFANNVQNQMSSSNSNLQPFLNPTQSTFGDSDPILPDITNTNNQATQTVQNNINNVVGSGMASHNGLNVLTSSGQTVRGFANNVQNQMSSSNGNLQPFLNPTQSTFGDSDPILPEVTNTNNQAINTVQNNINNVVGSGMASQNGLNTLTSSGQTVRGFANNVQNQMSSSNRNLQPFLNPTQSTFGDSDPILPDVTNTNNQAINTVQNNFNNAVGFDIASRNGLNTLTSSGQTVREITNNAQGQIASSTNNRQSSLHPSQYISGDLDSVPPSVYTYKSQAHDLRFYPTHDVQNDLDPRGNEEFFNSMNSNNPAMNDVTNVGLSIVRVNGQEDTVVMSDGNTVATLKNSNNPLALGAGTRPQNDFHSRTSDGNFVREFANYIQHQMSPSNSNLKNYLNPSQHTLGATDPALSDVMNTNNHQATNIVSTNSNNAQGSGIGDQNGLNTLTSSGQTVREITNHSQSQISSSTINRQSSFHPSQYISGDLDSVPPSVYTYKSQAHDSRFHPTHEVQNDLDPRGNEEFFNSMNSNNPAMNDVTNVGLSIVRVNGQDGTVVMSDGNTVATLKKSNNALALGAGTRPQNDFHSRTSDGNFARDFANNFQHQTSSSNSNLKNYLNPSQHTLGATDPALSNVMNTNNHQATNIVSTNSNNALGSGIGDHNGLNTLTSSGQTVREITNNAQGQIASSTINRQSSLHPSQYILGDLDSVPPSVYTYKSQAHDSRFHPTHEVQNDLDPRGNEEFFNSMNSNNPAMNDVTNVGLSIVRVNGQDGTVVMSDGNTVATLKKSINALALGAGTRPQNDFHSRTSDGNFVREFANNVQHQMSSSNSNFKNYLNPSQHTLGDSDPALSDVMNTNNHQATNIVSTNSNNALGSGVGDQNGLNTLTSSGQTVREITNNAQGQIASSTINRQSSLHPSQYILGDLDSVPPSVYTYKSQAHDSRFHPTHEVQNDLDPRGNEEFFNSMNSNNPAMNDVTNVGLSIVRVNGQDDTVVMSDGNTVATLKKSNNPLALGAGTRPQNDFHSRTSDGNFVREFANNVQHQMSSSNSNFKNYLNPSQHTLGDSDPALSDVMNTNNHQATNIVSTNSNNALGSGVGDQNGLNTLTSSGQTVREITNNAQGQIASSTINRQSSLHPSQYILGDLDSVPPSVYTYKSQAHDSRFHPTHEVQNDLDPRGNEEFFNSMNSNNPAMNDVTNVGLSIVRVNGQEDTVVMSDGNTVATLKKSNNALALGAGTRPQNDFHSRTSDGNFVREFANNVQHQMSSSNSNFKNYLNPSQHTLGDSDPALSDVMNTNNHQERNIVSTNSNNALGSGVGDQNGLNTLTSSGQTVREITNNAQGQISSSTINRQSSLHPSQFILGDLDSVPPSVYTYKSQAHDSRFHPTHEVQNDLDPRGNEEFFNSMNSNNPAMNDVTNVGLSIVRVNGQDDTVVMSDGNTVATLKKSNNALALGAGTRPQNDFHSRTSDGNFVREFANNVQHQTSSSNSNLKNYLNPSQHILGATYPALSNVMNTNNHQATNIVSTNSNNALGSGIGDQNGLNTLTSSGQTVREITNNAQSQISSSTINRQSSLYPSQYISGDLDSVPPSVYTYKSQAHDSRFHPTHEVQNDLDPRGNEEFFNSINSRHTLTSDGQFRGSNLVANDGRIGGTYKNTIEPVELGLNFVPQSDLSIITSDSQTVAHFPNSAKPLKSYPSRYLQANVSPSQSALDGSNSDPSDLTRTYHRQNPLLLSDSNSRLKPNTFNNEISQKQALPTNSHKNIAYVNKPQSPSDGTDSVLQNTSNVPGHADKKPGHATHTPLSDQRDNEKNIAMPNGVILKESQLKDILESIHRASEVTLIVPHLFSGPLSTYAHVMDNFPSSLEASEGFLIVPPSDLLVPYSLYKYIASLYAPDSTLFKDHTGIVLSSGQYIDPSTVATIVASTKEPSRIMIILNDGAIIPFEIYKSYICKLSSKDRARLRVLLAGLNIPIGFEVYKEVLETYLNDAHEDTSSETVVTLLNSKTRLSYGAFLSVVNNYKSLSEANVMLPDGHVITIPEFEPVSTNLSAEVLKKCIVYLPNSRYRLPFLVLREIVDVYIKGRLSWYDLSSDEEVNKRPRPSDMPDPRQVEILQEAGSRSSNSNLDSHKIFTCPCYHDVRYDCPEYEK